MHNVIKFFPLLYEILYVKKLAFEGASGKKSMKHKKTVPIMCKYLFAILLAQNSKAKEIKGWENTHQISLLHVILSDFSILFLFELLYLVDCWYNARLFDFPSCHLYISAVFYFFFYLFLFQKKIKTCIFAYWAN